MPAKNLQRSIRTRVIIGDYRIYVFADIVQRISENKCFIAKAGDSDQKVPMTQEAPIASNDLFTVAELPTTRAQHDRRPGCDKEFGTNDGGRAQ
jgi:hypothetical protein